MILCLPFLMFQGRAQEAIDLYLETFPDAELLEVMHHPEGTEIYDPAQQAPTATTPDELDELDELGEPDDDAEADVDEELNAVDPVASAQASADLEDVDQPAEDPAAGTADQDAQPLPAAASPRFDDTAAMETVVDWETTLVATAQLKIGGQMLMIQDSLIKRDFDFTPSTSIAVVVDTAEEFSHITDRLAAGGTFLMEPGDYDFAENFAWVRDRFGVAWQINQSSAPSSPDGAADSPIAQAPVPDVS